MTESEFMQQYAGKLNDQQKEAVKKTDGAVLLLAVPGSGKTTVLVTRLGYMIYCCGIAPEHILTLTYTVAATHDMEQRFCSMFGEDISDRLEFRTINGICAKVIARYGRQIGKNAFELITDEKKSLKILTDILTREMDEYPTESDVRGARTLITYCKNMMLSKSEIEALGKKEGIPLLELYAGYNDYLRTNQLMDYDDQMVYAYTLLRKDASLLAYYRDQYRYICVDEAQDTSKIQHELIKLLAGQGGNLFMVGDEDQSIYGFRAAYPEALLHFEKDHPDAKVLVMDKNYRSNARIVAAADLFIQHNTMRHDKHMHSTRGNGDEIRCISLSGRSNQYNYLFKVALNCQVETAVLYRDNESAIPLIDQLERKNVPYTDVVNILRLSLDPYDEEAFLRVYFKCQTFLKKAQAIHICRIAKKRNIPIPDAFEYDESLNGLVLGKCRAFRTHLKNMADENPAKAIHRIERFMGYGEYLERSGLDDNKLYILRMLSYNEETIRGFLTRLNVLWDTLKNKKPDKAAKFILSTIHSSKGLEYHEVYLMDVCDGVFPTQVIKSAKRADREALKAFEEERRLFYVGVTRAKEKLNIFTFQAESSCFVKELLAKNGGNKAQNDRRTESRLKPSTVPYRREAGRKIDFTIDDLVIGEEVRQFTYGDGVITDVEPAEDRTGGKITVEFASGVEKVFLFPMAFAQGRMIRCERSYTAE